MIRGGCACGRVRYEADCEPLFGVLCHCRDCQRASGTGHVPVMGVSRAGFRVTGSPRSHTVPGASGKASVRHFCADCGSLLFGTPEVAAEIATIYVGSLDDPGLFAPQYAQFTRERWSWDEPGARIPEHATTPR